MQSCNNEIILSISGDKHIPTSLFSNWCVLYRNHAALLERRQNKGKLVLLNRLKCRLATWAAALPLFYSPASVSPLCVWTVVCDPLRREAALCSFRYYLGMDTISVGVGQVKYAARRSPGNPILSQCSYLAFIHRAIGMSTSSLAGLPLLC